MAKTALNKLPGRIYRRRDKHPDGTVTQRSTWTVRYKGKDHATGETDPAKAKQFLIKLMAGTAAPAKPWTRELPAAAITVAAEPVKHSMSKVLDLFLADSKRRNLASYSGNEGIVRNYLRPFFGSVPANELTTELLNSYKDKRMESARDLPPDRALARAATVNRELGSLKRALNYSMREHDPPLLQRYPKITMLPEATPRKGFLPHRDYGRLRMALPDYWEPVFVTAYHVGRRRGELLQIQIEDVDLGAKQPHIRVYGDITKNGQPSLIPIYGDMIETLKKQIKKTRREFPACKLLFHKNGESIHKNEAFYAAWKASCEMVGLDGLLFHDLRRTACKMLIDAGNSRKEAMLISGHKTESAFNRYHIVDQSNMTGIAQKAAKFLAAEQAALLEIPPAGLVS